MGFCILVNLYYLLFTCKIKLNLIKLLLRLKISTNSGVRLDN